MELLFLGTGAADYNETHRAMDGYRRNASLLIDGCLLIDPGPCVPDALKTFGVNTKNIRYIINTHKHSDHYCQATVDALIAQGATMLTLENGEERTVGNYRITALEGNHAIAVQHFVISDGEKSLFYGLDSAWLLYSEIDYLRAHPVDYAVLDGTVGFIEGDYRVFEHCNLQMILVMWQSMRPFISRLCISHMARTLHTDHLTLSREMAKHDIEVAYDGYRVSV